MNLFSVLADPTRRRIVEVLGTGERAAGAIATEFPISAPAISQHLKTLRESGLVRMRIDGQRRIYSLDPDGMAEMEAWFAQFRPFWKDRLDTLEYLLARDKTND